MNSERSVCTSAAPMPTGDTGRWQHPDAVSTPSGSDYFDWYKCPHCGLEFAVELPE
jgi:hypothetical protein